MAQEEPSTESPAMSPETAPVRADEEMDWGRLAAYLRVHLPQAQGKLTATVFAGPSADAAVIALPHPSPRNNRWLLRNPWFERDRVPALRARVPAILEGVG